MVLLPALAFGRIQAESESPSDVAKTGVPEDAVAVPVCPDERLEIPITNVWPAPILARVQEIVEPNCTKLLHCCTTAGPVNGRTMLYPALTMALGELPAAIAMACTVSVAETIIGLEYRFDAAVGVLPLVV